MHKVKDDERSLLGHNKACALLAIASGHKSVLRKRHSVITSKDFLVVFVRNAEGCVSFSILFLMFITILEPLLVESHSCHTVS